jgi:hypothetical protein
MRRLRFVLAASVVVGASAAWAGTAYAKADVTVRVAGPIANGRVELRRESTAGLRVVAKLPARPIVTFRGVADGRYVVAAASPDAVGSFTRLEVGARPLSVAVSLRAPRLDGRRRVAANFKPGTPLVIEAADASGAHYQLFLPKDALAAETPVTLTPLAAVVAPGASTGFGVKIEPATATLKREGELKVTGAGGALRRYDPGSAAWLPVARDAVAGDGRYVASALGLYAAAKPSSELRQANLVYALAQRHYQDAVLEAAAGGPGMRALLAASKGPLRAAFNAFAKKGCTTALDKRGLLVARAIPSVLPRGEKAKVIPASRLKGAAGRCSAQARTLGVSGCRAAETAQDAAARTEAREEYLAWAFQLAKAYGISTKQSSNSYSGCVGLSFKAVVKFQRRSITLVAFTCGDTVAGAWRGTVTTGGNKKDNGEPVNAEVEFDLRTDGSRIGYWPGGNAPGADGFGPFVQQTWLTASTTAVTLAALVMRGDTVSETPTASGMIIPGTRRSAKQSPCGALS